MPSAQAAQAGLHSAVWGCGRPVLRSDPFATRHPAHRAGPVCSRSGRQCNAEPTERPNNCDQRPHAEVSACGANLEAFGLASGERDFESAHQIRARAVPGPLRSRLAQSVAPVLLDHEPLGELVNARVIERQSHEIAVARTVESEASAPRLVCGEMDEKGVARTHGPDAHIRAPRLDVQSLALPKNEP